VTSPSSLGLAVAAHPFPTLIEARTEQHIDTAHLRSSHLLIGKNGAHVRLSATAHQLMAALRAGMTLDDIARELNQRPGQRPVSVQDLEVACRRIADALERIEGNEISPSPSGFWLCRPLIAESVVNRISAALLWLFDWQVATPAICLVLAAAAHAVQVPAPVALPDDGFVAGYGLFLLSLLAHEFGHSTACLRYGVRPGHIGFAMYLIFPALYSDVTRAWSASRLQRVIIDLAGNYFQAVVGAVFLIGYQLTGEQALRVATSFIGISMLFSLNPVFKCDGYWVVSDALGVTNLSQQPRNISALAWAKLTGRSMTVPWSSATVAALALYTVCAFAVWASVVTHLTPEIWQRFSSYLLQLNALWQAMIGVRPDALPMLRTFLVSTCILAATLVMTSRLLRSLANSIGLPSLASACVAWVRRGSAPNIR